MFAPEEKRYEEIIGSLRATKQVSKDLFIFSGLSQGFRPPSYMISPLLMRQVPWKDPIPNLTLKNFCRLNWAPEEIQVHGMANVLLLHFDKRYDCSIPNRIR